MEWDFSALTNVGWIIGIAVAIFGIFYTRTAKPKSVRKIVIRSKKADPSLGICVESDQFGSFDLNK